MKIKSKIWNKLVRDKIPEVIKLNGGEATIKVVEDREERLELLKIKLKEEAQEVFETGKNGLLEECADVLTVLESIIDISGFDWQELKEMQAEKDSLKGRFEKGIVLIETKG